MLAANQGKILLSPRTGWDAGEAHYLFGFLRNSSRVGPSRPRGSSGTMKRFPAKVKGSRLDTEERRHICRGALDPPTPHCCLDVSTGAETHISPRQVLVGTVLRTLSLPNTLLPGLPDNQREGTAQPPHRSLTISFLELFIRMWSCSLVTMTPSVSSASFTMNLQGERESLMTSDQPLPSWASGEMNLQLHFVLDQDRPW